MRRWGAEKVVDTMRRLAPLVVVLLAWPALVYAEEPITVITSTVRATDGVIFTAPGALVVADRDGRIVFSRSLSGRVDDFKRQGEVLTYFNWDQGRFEVLDKNYRLIDTWRAVGYPTDVHDLQLLPNGHALLLVYREFSYDMSLVVPGGSPTATVVSCVIQELGPDKGLVWQWDSWDHLPITGTDVSLTANRIDYAHCNAVEPDGEAVLLSNRHLSNVVKINRATGAVIWQLGGVGNDFAFVNDSGFERQHDIRRLANGRLTLFDNGGAGRGYSRAVEYAIDEPGRVVTRMWEYRGPWAFCCGNAQRLPGGNTLINWGPAHPTITEIDNAGQVVFAADTTGSYRSFKFHWWQPYYFPLIFK